MILDLKFPQLAENTVHFSSGSSSSAAPISSLINVITSP